MNEELVKIASDPTTRGIIIGSFFTVLGIIVQGVISWLLELVRHSWMARDEKVRFERATMEQVRKEKHDYLIEWQKKREKAYLDFACLYSRLLAGAQLSAQKSGKMELLPPDLSNSNPKALEIAAYLGNMSDVNSALRLYGSPEVCIAASNFYTGLLKCEQAGQMTKDQIAASIVELDAVIGLMNREGVNLGLTKKEESKA